MKELERCPYCGSSHVRTTSVEVEAGRNHWAFCAECSASGPTSPSEQEAARRWNEVAGLSYEIAETGMSEDEELNENDELLRGTSRMRVMIHDQRDSGEKEFHMGFEEAMDLFHECRAEVIEGRGDLLDLQSDLGIYEEDPTHYKGDGTVSCARAMRSMLEGWQRGAARGVFALAGCVPLDSAYWATSAFKYLWRWPLKGHPREDLLKALDCCQRALEAWGDAE